MWGEAILRLRLGQESCLATPVRHVSQQSAKMPLGGSCEGESMIKKVAGGYQVLSSKGRNMGGPYKTRKEALKRLRQVEFFKHKKG
jgi:hypothetical protein